MTIATLGPISRRADARRHLTRKSPRDICTTTICPATPPARQRPSAAPDRREIGHGALAERSLVPVLPSVEEFPYAIRLVSEVVSSNGSTSQASVCGSTLALMDAGVPIKAPVAGISCGLITADDGTLDDHDRYSGSGRLLRRYGLQGRRHAQGYHLHSDGPEDRRSDPRDHQARLSR